MDNTAFTMKDYIVSTTKKGIDWIAKKKEILADTMKLIRNKQYDRIVIVATGSSYNAATESRIALQHILGISTSIVEANIYSTYDYKYYKNSLIIGISQSGTSKSTIAAMKIARNINSDVIIFTSDKNSPISEYASSVVDIGCGHEELDYVTLGHNMTLIALFGFAVYGSFCLGKITDAKCAEYFNELENILNGIEIAANSSEQWYEKNKKELLAMKRVYLIGSGPNYGTCAEGALKLVETLHINATYHEIESFTHGPHLAVDKYSYCICIGGYDKEKEKIEAVFNGFCDTTEYSYFIGCRDVNDKCMCFSSEYREIFSPLACVIPLQMLTFLLCRDKNIDLIHDQQQEFRKYVTGHLY
ncbi:SIS domain-containing protein [Clostridium oryzae]|uniref:Glutamine--fructose-6-phosphate aminotransferase n=1 Tax=Clostridium oryzae TaxID=1450648 RepID=A0A1V4IM75_9CLOT|nr:SIS domain-containing protein [Clostridium oryzae]OPJ60969.1 glutamine--fructose-6-phosphate aminotransferase [Clostridium oryzae]